MATFEARVEGLTGLSIDGSSSPTQDELTEYLKDGVIDVTSRWILVRPQDSDDFLRVTSELDTNGQNIGSADILSVVREAGDVNDWRPCRKVSPGAQTRVTDISSLEFASKYNPVFIKWHDKSIAVYPAPGASPNRYKIFYVNNVPTFSGGSNTYDSDTIHYFPNDKVHLVMLYVGIKALDNALSVKSDDFPSDITTLVLPAAPADADIDFSSVPTIVGYVMPTLSLTDQPTIADPPSSPVLTSSSVTFNETAPTYNPPVLGDLDFADVDDWINVEEDEVMSAARVQVMGAKLSEFDNNMTNALNIFNNENNEYQTKFKQAIKDVEMHSADDIQAVQKFQQDLISYQADVNHDIELWKTKRTNDIQQYQYDITNETTRFSTGLEDFKSEVDKALKKYESETGYDTSKYQQEIVGAIQKYSTEVQDYTAKLTKVRVDYEWMMSRRDKLQVEYNIAFGLAKPKEEKTTKRRNR